MRPDGAPPDRRRDHSRFRVIAGLLGTAVAIAVGAVLGWWQTRPPADDPGPDDPMRRSSRPW